MPASFNGRCFGGFQKRKQTAVNEPSTSTQEPSNPYPTPPKSGTKRPPDSDPIQPIRQPNFEQASVEPTAPPAEAMETTGGQAGSSIGAAVNGPQITIKNHELKLQGHYKFRKTFQLMSGCFNYSWIQIDNWKNFLSTGMLAFDPNCLPLFMSDLEFQLLPAFSTAKSCRIKITPLFYRLPFATNDAASNWTNSQTVVQIRKAVGLNRVMPHVTGGATINAANMTISSLQDQTMTALSDLLYGNETPTQSSPFAAVAGVPKYWPRYSAVAVNGVGTYNQPNLGAYTSIENINDVKGKPCIDYTYKYHCGILKMAGHGTINSGLTTGDDRVVLGGTAQDYSFRKVTYNDSSSPPQTSANITNGMYTSTGNLPTFDYAHDIEKGAWLKPHQGGEFMTQYPDIVNVGGCPVISSAPYAQTEHYADCAIHWLVETELDVEWTQDSITHHDFIVNPRYLDPMFGVNPATTFFNHRFLKILLNNTLCVNVASGTITYGFRRWKADNTPGPNFLKALDEIEEEEEENV